MFPAMVVAITQASASPDQLLGNALKFTAIARIVLQASRPQPARGHLTVSLPSRYGVGISGDLQQKIFEPFSAGR